MVNGHKIGQIDAKYYKYNFIIIILCVMLFLFKTRIQNLVLGIEQVVGLVSIINLHDNQVYLHGGCLLRLDTLEALQ